MTKSGVKVLGMWASPFSIKVQMSLLLKCVDYEFIEEDILNKSDRLLEANPVYKKTPVLIHNEKVICESGIIVEYVDDVWTNAPTTILPSDPYDRAMARFWAAYVDKLYPCMRTVLYSDGDEAKKTAGLEDATQVLVTLEDAFIKCSKGKNFFGGDEIGYTDITLGSYLTWIRLLENFGNITLIDESKTPNLSRWAQHFSAVDIVKDVLPETDKLMEFGNAFAAKLKANKF
ncbi:glutathione s-transferase [Orobanche minor]